MYSGEIIRKLDELRFFCTALTLNALYQFMKLKVNPSLRRTHQTNRRASRRLHAFLSGNIKKSKLRHSQRLIDAWETFTRLSHANSSCTRWGRFSYMEKPNLPGSDWCLRSIQSMGDYTLASRCISIIAKSNNIFFSETSVHHCIPWSVLLLFNRFSS